MLRFTLDNLIIDSPDQYIQSPFYSRPISVRGEVHSVDNLTHEFAFEHAREVIGDLRNTILVPENTYSHTLSGVAFYIYDTLRELKYLYRGPAQHQWFNELPELTDREKLYKEASPQSSDAMLRLLLTMQADISLIKNQLIQDAK